jgi:hypothetical protein
MFPFHGLQPVSSWLRSVSEPFARPLSPRTLRVIIIAAPFLVLISQGPLWTLLCLWCFAAWLLPTVYHEVLRSRSLHQEASARAWAAESSLRQAAAQRLGLELELQRRFYLEGQLQTTQSALQEANEEILKITIALQRTEDELRKERDRKKSDPTAGASNPVFRRVGLDPSAPRFAIEAVRKAYRKNLHPDLQPVERKAEAERRFKESEQVFDEIWRLRGL